MKLKNYISEAISSGRTISKSKDKGLEEDIMFADALNWFIDNGCEPTNTNDFGYKNMKHRDKPVVSGYYDKGYDASVIKLFIPYDGYEYWFDLLFDGNTEKLREIFAYKGLYSIMNNESLIKKLSFIKKCLA